MFLALSATVAFAAPLPKPELSLPGYSNDASVLCFPSGLQVHAVRRPGASVVTVAAVVEGGEMGEDPAARGAAHLLEHVWFGARPDGGATVADVLSALPHQGLTFSDATVFVTTAAPQDLQALMNIEAIRLGDPLLGVDESTVAFARRVVRSEHAWRGADVSDPVVAELEPAWFGDAPEWAAHRSATAAQAAAVDLAALRAYAARWYRPENVTIRVEGAVDPKAIEAIVGATFPRKLLTGDRTSCAHAPAEVEPPARADGALRTIEAPVDHPTLALGWVLPSAYGPQADAAEGAALSVQGYLEAALEGVRKMDEDDVGLECHVAPGAVVSELVCTTRLSDGVDPEKALRAVRARLPEVWHGMGDTKFNREVWSMADVVGELDAGASLDEDAVAERALASHFAPDGVDPYREAGLALQLSDAGVGEYGRRWVVAERLAAVLIRPALPHADERSALTGEASLVAPRPSGWHAPASAAGGWTHSTLKSGADVWVLARPGTRLAHTALVIPGGRARGPIGASDAHSLLAEIDRSSGGWVSKGTGTMTMSRVGAASWYARSLGPGGNLDAQVWEVWMHATALEYFGRTGDFQNPSMRAALRRMTEYPEEVVDWAHAHHLFAGTRLGLAWWEGWAAAKEMSRADAAAWQAASIRPAVAELFVAGEVDSDGAHALAKRFLQGWKSNADALPPAEVAPLPDRARTVAVEGSSALGALSVACRLPARTAQNDAAIDVARWLTAQGLEQTFRQRGALYFVRATSTPRGPSGGELTLRASVPPADADAALRAMADLLARVGEGPSEAMLRWARFGVKTERALTTSTASGALDLAAEAAQDGLTPDDLAGYEARVDAVTADAVREALAGCAGRESRVYVGPKTELPGAEWVDWPAMVDEIVRAW